MGIGDNIAMHRRAKGWAQKMLAEATGISQGYIEDIEQGRRKPGVKTLAVIAARLGVKIEKLTGD